MAILTSSGITDNSGKPLLNGSGSIIQVVSAVTQTQTDISSTSFTSTALSCSITPTSTSSRILIMAHGTMNTPGGGGTHTIVTIYLNNTTNLGDTTLGFGNSLAVTGTPYAFESKYSIHTIHSPSTTSSTTYTVYGKQFSAGTGNFNLTGRVSTMVLMEIV